MATNLSIENAPDDIVALLRDQARQHDRSLEAELLAIVENAIRSAAEKRAQDRAELYAEIRALGVKSPSESAAMIREDRDDPRR